MKKQPHYIIKLLSKLLFLSYLGVVSAQTEAPQPLAAEEQVEEVAVKKDANTSAPPQLLPYVIVDNLIFISGQLPIEDGQVKYTGKLGDTVTIEQGYAAAKLAAENVLKQVEAAVGSLDKVERAVKVTGFVNATPDFTQHPQVINGASDAFIAALGENGQHARLAVGAPSLPLDVSVEVEAIFQLKP